MSTAADSLNLPTEKTKAHYESLIQKDANFLPGTMTTRLCPMFTMAANQMREYPSRYYLVYHDLGDYHIFIRDNPQPGDDHETGYLHPTDKGIILEIDDKPQSPPLQTMEAIQKYFIENAKALSATSMVAASQPSKPKQPTHTMSDMVPSKNFITATSRATSDSKSKIEKQKKEIEADNRFNLQGRKALVNKPIDSYLFRASTSSGGYSISFVLNDDGDFIDIKDGKLSIDPATAKIVISYEGRVQIFNQISEITDEHIKRLFRPNLAHAANPSAPLVPQFQGANNQGKAPTSSKGSNTALTVTPNAASTETLAAAKPNTGDFPSIKKQVVTLCAHLKNTELEEMIKELQAIKAMNEERAKQTASSNTAAL